MKLEAGKRGEKMKADENPCRKFTDACFRAFYIFTANGSVISMGSSPPCQGDGGDSETTFGTGRTGGHGLGLSLTMWTVGKMLEISFVFCAFC